jgi:serine protease Do
MLKYRFMFGSMLITAALIMMSGYAQGQYPRRSPAVEAFEKSKDAVVNIASKQVARVQDGFFDFWGWNDFPFYGRRVEIPSLGSGFIISTDGYIVTNAHVVQEADEITIIMADDKGKYKARRIAADSSADLAILKIDPNSPLPTIDLGYSDDLMTGETVLAIGNPFGYQSSLTDGIISAIHRDIELGEAVAMSDLVQISAPINPGNSGGPLLNINGQVIGINTAIRKTAQGISFAIPIDKLRSTIPLMLNLEKMRRIDLGLTTTYHKTPQNKQGASLPGQDTITVQSVQPNGAAERAGIKVGDVITGIDGKKVHGVIDFYLQMLEKKADDTVAFDLWRGKDVLDAVATNQPGQALQKSITLKARPQPDGKQLAEDFFGITTGNLTEELKDSYKLAGKVASVVVIGTKKQGPAYNAGIEPGDVIIAINNEPVENLEQLALKLEFIKPGSLVKMRLQRTQRNGWGYNMLLYDTTLRTQGGEKDNESKKAVDL